MKTMSKKHTSAKRQAKATLRFAAKKQRIKKTACAAVLLYKRTDGNCGVAGKRNSIAMNNTVSKGMKPGEYRKAKTSDEDQ